MGVHMKLDDSQRMIGIKSTVLTIFRLDIWDKRYNELQQVYEALNLKTNSKLVNKLTLNEHRDIASFFTDTVYMDIAFVIDDCISTRTDIIELVDSLYAKRFPSVKQYFGEMERQYALYKSATNLKAKKLLRIEYEYIKFLAYKSKIIDEPERVINGFDFEEDRSTLNYSFYLADKDLIDETVVFRSIEDNNEKEYVFQSTAYGKYLKKRREDLAEFLNIKESFLADYIHETMRSHSIDGVAEIRLGTEGMIETLTKNIIANHNGGMAWYNEMTSVYNSSEFLKYIPEIAYVPNVDGLIENYFKSYVTTCYMEELRKKNPFTKITLSRECIPNNYREVYITILCMYEMDVLYKMFAIMQKQYYMDFSWEKITNQSLSVRYESLISNLEQTIADKKSKIESLDRKNKVLSLQLESDKSKELTPIIAENNKLLKIIDSKDFEIEELKKKLQIQEEFTAELNHIDVDKENNNYNIDILKTKRYLFVGRFEEALPELKHDFPNSLFMEGETYNLLNVKVDAIVMLVRWMSHSMFYKIKATGSLTDTKIIMCNTKNKDTIYQKMFNEII